MTFGQRVDACAQTPTQLNRRRLSPAPARGHPARHWLLIALWTVSLAAPALATGARAEPIGACAWSKISPATKIRVLDAYHAGLNEVASALHEMSADLPPYFAECSSSDLSASDMASMIATQAIKYAAATDLVPLKIRQTDLDRAWQLASQGARDCATAASAIEFGMEPPPCAGPQASFSFMQQLNIPPTAAPLLVHQVLAYMAAKGQEYWEDNRSDSASTLASAASAHQGLDHSAGH